MKKVCLVGAISLLLICLSACVSEKTIRRTAMPEKIQALWKNKNNYQVYAIGTQFDYEINPCSSIVQIDSPLVDSSHIGCFKTLDFIVSENMKERILAVDIPMVSILSGTRNQVSGHYKNYFAFTEEEAKKHKKNKIDLRNAEAHMERKLREKHGINKNKQIYHTHIWFYGRVVQLKNKAQLLQAGKLKVPISTTARVSVLDKRFTANPIKSVGEGVIAVVLAPVTLALLVPYLSYGRATNQN